ncbi:MAG TPA: hypothetical protein VNJ02_03510 [Vicinamibacterales bacterium]|nr:hypothetical protein [Vicinamibacterales bacterium]
MKPIVEACLLPLLFLTVIWLAALRPGGPVMLVIPSVGALVMAMVLLSLFVRSGTLAPDRLMHQSRSALANSNGLVLLLCAAFASAAVINLVIPDDGVPALIGWAVLVSLLMQALAIAPDRQRLLRGLLVTFGAAFTLKFVILAAVSAPAESRTARILQLLFDGLTLGSISQRPPHPLEGYLALVTLVLYFIGLAMLPSARRRIEWVEQGVVVSGDRRPATGD